MVRSKRHRTACAIGPKGEARTHGPRVPSVPKAKLGYSNRVRHWVILPLVMAILGFLTIPWLGPKDTEPRATSVPKVKLGHTEPRATSVPKAKLGHTEPCATSVPKAKLGHTELRAPSVPKAKKMKIYDAVVAVAEVQ